MTKAQVLDNLKHHRDYYGRKHDEAIENKEPEIVIEKMWAAYASFNIAVDLVEAIH